jgi:hypothetical protein
LGVALIQQIAIEREVTAGTLKSLPLQDCDDTRTYLTASRKRGILTDAALRFIDILHAPK